MSKKTRFTISQQFKLTIEAFMANKYNEYDLKVSGDGKSIWLLCSWTLSIVLSLSKKPSYFPQNTMFRKLGSVSALRQNLLC
jgi:hypothetical protein